MPSCSVLSRSYSGQTPRAECGALGGKVQVLGAGEGQPAPALPSRLSFLPHLFWPGEVSWFPVPRFVTTLACPSPPRTRLPFPRSLLARPCAWHRRAPCDLTVLQPFYREKACPGPGASKGQSWATNTRLSDPQGQAITMVLCHLPGLTPAVSEPLGQRLEAGRAPGLAASFSEAWPGPRSWPAPYLAGGTRPWVSSTGVPRLPPSSPSLPPGQYCSQRKCPV